MKFIECCIRNLATLAGFCLVLAAAFLSTRHWFPLWLGAIFFWLSGALLGVTGFGTHTYSAYKKTMTRFLRAGEIRMPIPHIRYCRRVGINLASKEIEKIRKSDSRPSAEA